MTEGSASGDNDAFRARRSQAHHNTAIVGAVEDSNCCVPGCVVCVWLENRQLRKMELAKIAEWSEDDASRS